MDYPVLIFTAAFLVPFAVLLPIYLKAEATSSEREDGFKRATALKVALSSYCALCGLLGFLFWGMQKDPIGILIPVALISSVAGDYYLQFISMEMKKFRIGITFFALTQVLLIVFLSLHHGISWPEFVFAALMLFGLFLLVARGKWNLGHALWPLVGYTFLVALMTGKAVFPLFSGVGISPSMIVMGTGALLFILSDILLSIKNFSGRKKTKTKNHLIVYFSAILLIALSVAF